MQSEIDHPRWDDSWATPSEHTIDDLAELGLLRVEPSANKARTFALTMRGRGEGAALTERMTSKRSSGGRAPAADMTLRWLVSTYEEAPECFDAPGRLIDRAVTEGMIDMAGREPVARRILGLVADGYLRGNVPALDQATAEQVLSLTTDLELTIRAHESGDRPAEGQKVTFLGPVINSQVAGGDISNYTVFVEVLDRAYQEVEALDNVDVETKEQAKGLLDRLRGKAGSASEEVATSAAGELVAGVVARLIGMPLG